MQLHLTDEQRMLIHTVRRFVQEEIVPLERELDPDAYELPRDQHERLVAMTKAMGLYQMALPKEYGGQEVDIITRVLLTEEMAQHRAGLYHPSYDEFGEHPPAYLHFGTERQKEENLSPDIPGEQRCLLGL